MSVAVPDPIRIGRPMKLSPMTAPKLLPLYARQSVVLLLQRLLLVAVPTWLLWLVLIGLSAPSQQAGVAKTVFLVSSGLALCGALWACWSAWPQHALKPRRRAVNIGLGLLAFLVIVLIGHAMGTALAWYLR